MKQNMNKDPYAAQKRALFRDQAAYLHLTGRLPTHLRSAANSTLLDASIRAQGVTPWEAGEKVFELKPETAKELKIEDHPMVRMVDSLVQTGWVIQPSLGSNRRRPYGKIYLKRGEERRVVQRDGSILMHWPHETPS